MSHILNKSLISQKRVLTKGFICVKLRSSSSPYVYINVNNYLIIKEIVNNYLITEE